MAQKILLKRSSVPGKVPTVSDLDLGEMGVNTADGAIYIKKDSGTPVIVKVGGGINENSVASASTLTIADGQFLIISTYLDGSGIVDIQGSGILEVI